MKEFYFPDAKFICAVKELGNTAEVLKFMGIGPTSLNVYTKRIEERMGKTLFSRNKKLKTIELNEEGLEIYPICKKMISLASSINDLSEAEDNMHGEVKITATQTLLENFCLPYLIEFVDINPRINVVVNQLDNMFLKNQSVNEFYFTSELHDDSDVYAYFPYHDFVQKLWASPKYLEKHGKIKSIQDLYRHTVLFQRGMFTNDKMQGVPAKVRTSLAYNEVRTFEITGSRAIDFLCESGLGIMSGSEETITLCGLKVQRVLESVIGETVQIYIKVNKKFLGKKIGKLFLDWIFTCRDQSLQKGGFKPTYEYKNLCK